MAEISYPRNQALHVPMRDGVRIALDVWLPEGLQAGQRIGTVMRSTRYWRARGYTDRAIERDSNFAAAELFNGAGYAHVTVDARGTGASFGISQQPWAEDEVADYGEVVDWIAAQSWSNGRVATIGISYDANTAECTAISNPAGLKAVVPRFSDYDFYQHVIFPGGIAHRWLIKAWSDYVRMLDDNDVCGAAGVSGTACDELRARETGVKPVDVDPDGRLLAAAVDEHAPNPSVEEALSQIVFHDDRYNGGPTMTESVLPAFKEQIERSGVAYQAWASWLDAGTQAGVLSRFNTFNNPQQVIIGAWNHGARSDADPFVYREHAPEADFSGQFKTILDFLQPYLHDGAIAAPVREVAYYTLGSGEWRTTTSWPPAGSDSMRLHFGSQNCLVQDAQVDGIDEYAIDFSATSGTTNRWHTQLGGSPVLYPNRTEQASKLLIYRSEALEHDLLVTGHPVVQLTLSSTHSDGAFHVYLESVSPDGDVTYITEGLLRGLHRAVRPAEDSPAAVYGPYHSYARADAAPIVPGVPFVLAIELFPTSVQFARGSRIQVGIAGADADTFERIPQEGQPVIQVRRSGSWIDLPIQTT